MLITGVVVVVVGSWWNVCLIYITFFFFYIYSGGLGYFWMSTANTFAEKHGFKCKHSFN